MIGVPGRGADGEDARDCDRTPVHRRAAGAR
jgi:hypothetical protein